MAPEAAGAGRERLVSLDAMRGFVIAAMLLVNATWGEDAWGEGLGGWLAGQLAHVPWNAPAQGATLTDLVFPWFLFIMGAAVPLSMRSGRGRGRSGVTRVLIALRRGAILYLLGVLLTHAGSWTERPMAWTDLLSWNILQLIGVSYVVATAVSLAPRWAWWAFVGVVLAAKTVVMVGLDPEWVRGALEAGSSPLAARNPEAPTGAGTFTHFDDVKRLLAREHVAPIGLASSLDRSALGWLGMAQQWLPAAAIAVLGALAADRLLDERTPRARRARDLALGGALATLLAFGLQAGYDAAGGGWLGPLTIPFSKWFFSPAYCLLAAGTGALLLAACFWTIDVRGIRRLAEPWRTYGVNALALYVGAELTWKLAISRWTMPTPDGGSSAIPGAVNAWVGAALPDGTLVPLPGGGLFWSAIAGVSFAVLWLAGWWLVCRWLDRRGIYLRV
jgi:predicted acyltransferase